MAVRLGASSSNRSSPRQAGRRASNDVENTRDRAIRAGLSSSSRISPRQGSQRVLAEVEIVKDRLYFASMASMPADTARAHYFSVDHLLRYEPFDQDFGPLNAGRLRQFCKLLSGKLRSPTQKGKRVVHVTGQTGQARANAVVLITAYSVLVLKRTPEEAFAPFTDVLPYLSPFRDAATGPSSFSLSAMDCVRGLRRATQEGLFDITTIDADEYLFYEQVENGDLNWLVPGRFLAFAGPNANPGPNDHPFTPEDYVPYFKKHGIKAVVRLNRKLYARTSFTKAGIDHLDIYFPDGAVPPEDLVRRFIEFCEATQGPVAVHCKAGLGRTGTLIACYLMKHHRFTAAEVIGFLRIMRPGSIIGPQQHFLQLIQQRLWHEGDKARRRAAGALLSPGAPLVKEDVVASISQLALGVRSPMKPGEGEGPVVTTPQVMRR